MLNKKKVISILTATLLVGSLVGCVESGEASSENKISISGSTSVGPTVEVLSEKYKKIKGIDIEVQQVGSSSGITNTIDGISQIGMSSRDLSDEEKAKGLDEHKVAIDGIAVITNPENRVQNLTLKQVRDIYSGKITNWKQVGGEDLEIVVVSREDGSGTRDGFQEIVGYESEDLTKKALISDGSGNIKTIVKGNKHAIGYISFGYLDKSIKALKIDGVEATEKNVRNHTYSISRPFLLVTKGKLNKEVIEFLYYILSEEGQKIIKEQGFISINRK